MEKIIKKAIEEYQCSGCISGCDTTCFKSDNGGSGCGEHNAGTMIGGAMGFIKIFLGMPKGFSRLGDNKNLRPRIFKTWEQLHAEWEYDMFNIPVWKYLGENGHTFIRGISPRINTTYIHVVLEDCMDMVECHELTEDELKGMD